MIKIKLTDEEATKLYGESINEMKFAEQCDILKEYPYLMESIKDQTDELQKFLIDQGHQYAIYIVNLNNKLQKELLGCDYRHISYINNSSLETIKYIIDCLYIEHIKSEHPVWIKYQNSIQEINKKNKLLKEQCDARLQLSVDELIYKENYGTNYSNFLKSSAKKKKSPKTN